MVRKRAPCRVNFGWNLRETMSQQRHRMECVLDPMSLWGAEYVWVFTLPTTSRPNPGRPHPPLSPEKPHPGNTFTYSFLKYRLLFIVILWPVYITKYFWFFCYFLLKILFWIFFGDFMAKGGPLLIFFTVINLIILFFLCGLLWHRFRDALVFKPFQNKSLLFI
jgi:hypothetical protein